MEPVLTTCGGCGRTIRVRAPEIAKRRACPCCGTILGPVAPQARPTPPRVAYLLTLLAILVVWLGESLLTSNPQAMGRTASAAVGLLPTVPPAVAKTQSIQQIGRSFDLQSRIAGWLRRNAGALKALSPLLWNGFSPQEPPAADDPASRDGLEAAPVLTPPDFGAPSSEALSAACGSKGVPRFLVRGDDGKPEVVRLHGHRDGKTVVLLPDGRLGIVSMVVPTDEPFVPLTADEIEKRAQTGPFASFQVHRTPHYVILYQSSKAFALSHGALLEDLHNRLLEAFRRHDVPVHEAEFPLVAVIFKTERDFREHRPVDHDVRAYYEIFSNRIFLYEEPDQDRVGPEINALLTTQTAAHEGTHQVLQNIGVQPRLAAWPLWLVEGLAEYCGSPARSRKGGPTWDGLGQINSLHMATLRELDDPVSLTMQGPQDRVRPLTRVPGQPLVESLLRKKKLTPTDYALAWAVTHYLAMKRGPEFTRFLTVMGQTAPLEPRTPDDHVRQFRDAFGDDLARMDKTVDAHLRKLSRAKGYDPLPYYAVMFEQPLPPGIVRRAAMVSQSPQVIHQWVQETTRPGGGMPSWQAVPHPTRARANLVIMEWMNGY